MFEQDQFMLHPEFERFVIVEAANQEQAFERAAYFGINVEERFEGSQRWYWPRHTFDGWGSRQPLILGDAPDHIPFTGGWIILYLNNNLKSSRVEFDDLTA